MTLEERLSYERLCYLISEQNFRILLKSLGKHFRGLPDTPSEAEIESHLSACLEYYKIFNTVDGEISPWIGKGEFVYESPKES